MKQEIEILRVVISSNISGSVLCDNPINWNFTNEQVVIAKLCQVLIQLATEFDDGIIQFASFNIPEEEKSQILLGVPNSGERNLLHLGLQLKDDIITAVFYKILVDKRIDQHNQFISTISTNISNSFLTQFSQLHQSIRPILESIAKEEKSMPLEYSQQFTNFNNEILNLINL